MGVFRLLFQFLLVLLQGGHLEGGEGGLGVAKALQPKSGVVLGPPLLKEGQATHMPPLRSREGGEGVVVTKRLPTFREPGQIHLLGHGGRGEIGLRLLKEGLLPLIAEEMEATPNV